MKKVIELKTIYKENFFKPEHFDNKIKRLRIFCIRESNPALRGQKYLLKVHPDNLSATLVLEINKALLNKEEGDKTE